MKIKESLTVKDKHSNKYPYLVVRMMSAVYQIQPLPLKLYLEDEGKMVSFIVEYSKKKDKRMCLVTSPSRGIYVEPNGSIKIMKNIPSGGMIIE